MGYHKKQITPGNFGDLSKIYEELEELQDAEDQKASILMLVEMSDLIGAIEGYLEKHFPGMLLSDLIQMSNLTKSAFKDGSRK